MALRMARPKSKAGTTVVAIKMAFIAESLCTAAPFM